MEWTGGVGGGSGDSNHKAPIPHNKIKEASSQQWEQFQVPAIQLMPSIGVIITFVVLQGQQNAFQKSRLPHIGQ